MATYTFRAVPAWGQPGQFARLGLGAGKRFTVTLPGGGLATVVQDGVTQVGFLLSDANGMIPSWTTTDILSVDVDLGLTIGPMRIDSIDAVTAGGASAAAAASSATDAASSATDAANSATAAASSASDAAATVAGKVDKGSLLVNVKDYGAKGDGTTLDHAAINDAIAAAAGRTVYLPAPLGAKTYLIDAVSPNGVKLNQPGTRLLLDPGAVIKVQTNSATTYIAVEVTAADCMIEGGTILGDGPAHTGTTGEWGHLIQVSAGGDRLHVKDTTVRNAWGDGIAAQGATTGLTLTNVTADDNRRQGLSLISVSQVRVYGGAYKNTGQTVGTAPQAGIDLEPNVAGDIISDVEFHGVTCTGNKGSGLQALFVSGSTTQTGPKIIGGSFSGNTLCGIQFPTSGGVVEDAVIDGATVEGNTSMGLGVDGSVNRLRIIGGRYRKNGQRGISVIPGSGKTAANVSIIGSSVMDNSQTTPGGVDGIRADGTVTGFKVAFVRSGGTSQRYGLTTNSTVSQACYIENDLSGNGTAASIYGDTASSRTRIEAGVISAGGAFGANGVTPVGKAANPGTATGTDAAVLNAVVTALRNVGIVT